MSYVTASPSIVTDADGRHARIRFLVKTRGAPMHVDSSVRERFTVHDQDGAGAIAAILVARKYARAHRGALDLLYRQIVPIQARP